MWHSHWLKLLRWLATWTRSDELFTLTNFFILLDSFQHDPADTTVSIVSNLCYAAYLSLFCFSCQNFRKLSGSVALLSSCPICSGSAESAKPNACIFWKFSSTEKSHVKPHGTVHIPTGLVWSVQCFTSVLCVWCYVVFIKHNTLYVWQNAALFFWV